MYNCQKKISSSTQYGCLIAYLTGHHSFGTTMSTPIFIQEQSDLALTLIGHGLFADLGTTV